MSGQFDEQERWREDLRERNDEFAFEEGEESLPWLESDEDEEQGSFDTTRILGIGLIMLVALGAIVGAVWWISNSSVAGGPEPDGSVIAAPEGPYKVRPSDAGGKTYPGTGDTSFAVGEGKTTDAKLASRPPEPSPTPSSSASEAPKPVTTASPALPKGTAVQVGAYSSRADAEAGWRTLTRETELLSGVGYRIIRGQADIGIVYRLQAVGGDPSSARKLCSDLQDAGLACTVK